MRNNFRRRISRDLTPGERDVLVWMLRNASTVSADLMRQVPQLRVVSECTCGCPTVDLELEIDCDRSDGVSGVIADAIGMSPELVEINVIVHASNGGVSELEVYSVTGEDHFSLPLTSHLRRWSDPAD
jgi:hypothetical protein